jgi:hypothetical protein
MSDQMLLEPVVLTDAELDAVAGSQGNSYLPPAWGGRPPALVFKRMVERQYP